MHAQFKRKKFFTLLLVLIAVFCIPGMGRAGTLTAVLSDASLHFTIGNPAANTKTITVERLLEVASFDLTALGLYDGSSLATSWNDIDIACNAAAKTIAFSGSPSSASAKSFTVRMSCDTGEVAEAPILLTATAGGVVSAALDRQMLLFYVGGSAKTETLNVITTPGDLTLTSLTLDPAPTWNGLTLTADPSSKTIAVSGTPSQIAATSVDVTATAADGSTHTASFSISAQSQSDRNKIDPYNVGIWDYGNTAMLDNEVVLYDGSSANTGYNKGGKYDLVFICWEMLDGDAITVSVKDPNDAKFVVIPRLTTAQIPLESWYYVNETPDSNDPYASPARGTATARGTGSSFGWTRVLTTKNVPMHIAVNSQPYVTGNYTIRIEYAFTDSTGATQDNTQEFTLRCTDPVNTGNNGGGCDAGLGLAGFFAGFAGIAGFAAIRRFSGRGR